MKFNILYFYFEIIGTIYFTISGTIAGIYKKIDVFGNLILAFITTVGCGMLRDMMANTISSIFTKNIYSISSIIGALVYIYTLNKIPSNYSISITSLIVFVIKILSEKYNIHLQKIE